MAVNRWTPSYSAVAEAPTSKKGAAAEVVDVPDDTIPRFRKGVKQVATLGPKTFNKEMIEKLFLAGVDVFRLNFSHGSHEEKSGLVDTMRKLEAELVA